MTQNEALAILKTGTNVFLTGEPGSGKTHTVNCYVAWLREHGIAPAITASTGIAAAHVNGYTIHSWSGIGVKRKLVKSDLDRIANNRRAASRVKKAHTLIIDEISMLSAQTFALAEMACRYIRGSSAPFGGLQVVLVGDFFQLPPVVERNEDYDNNDGGEMVLFETSPNEARDLFAFNSPVWSALNLNICYISEQYRQDDQEFLEVLSAIRSGTVSERHRSLLGTRLSRNVKDGITQFFSHNADVDRVNSAKLSKLPGEERVFDMESRGPKQLVERLRRGCLSPEALVLKTGAQVMFTKNDISQHRFVNGTLGTIIGFSKEDGNPIVKTNAAPGEPRSKGRASHIIFAEVAEWSIEESGRILARISQIPLRLAWAITVHKSQGISLDAAHMDLRDAFEHGQGYVAISRVRTLAGLSLAGWNDRALEVHPDICAKDAEFREASRVVRKNLATTPADELLKRQNDFIRDCSGSVEPLKKSGQADDNFIIIEPQKKERRWEGTLALIREGKTLEEVSCLRGRKPETIIQHIEELLVLEKLNRADISHLANGKENIIAEIHGVFQKLGADRLKPVFDHCGGHFPYEVIRLARLLYRDET